MTECHRCGATDVRIEHHHTDYDADETVPLCRDCHAGVHASEDDELKPPQEQVDAYYERPRVRRSQLPQRRGWTVQIKMVPCNRDNCPDCPHGPYYYYYQRQGDKVVCEYGGIVPDGYLVDQKQLAEF